MKAKGKMSMFLCIGVGKKCINYESYGEICVRCNCCGCFGRKGMWSARLSMYRRALHETLHFNRWFKDSPEMYALQKKNKKADVIYLRKKIVECKKHTGGHPNGKS